MGNPFEKVRPGQPFVFPAELYNHMVDVVQEVLLRNGITSGGSARNVVRVYNASGSPLDQFGVVGFGDTKVDPAVSENAFRSRSQVLIETAAPAVGGMFGIVQEPCPDTGLAEVLVSGITRCVLDVADVSDTYAGPAVGVYTALTSQGGGGPARIVWSAIPAATALDGGIDDAVTTLTVADARGWPDPATMGDFVVTIDAEDLLVTAVADATPTDTALDGAIDDAVTTITVADSTGWPDPAVTGEFVVTVDDEDLLVTAIAGADWTVERGHDGTDAVEHDDAAVVTFKSGVVGEDWTVERGYNSTTAASHADAAAVTFKSGVVWAIVLLEKPTINLGFVSDGTDVTIDDATPPAWNSSDNYVPGWLVTHGGKTYRCNQENQNVEPPDSVWGDVTGYVTTLAIPDAAADVSRGLVTNVDQVFQGVKKFVRDSGGGPGTDYGEVWIAADDSFQEYLRLVNVGGGLAQIGLEQQPGLGDLGTSIIFSNNDNTLGTTHGPGLLILDCSYLSAPATDTQPCYAIRYRTGGSPILHAGEWGTDMLGSVIEGGIITTIGAGTLTVPNGGTGQSTLGSNQLIAGNGTGAVNSMANTRNVSGSLQLKLGTNLWIGFSKGSA